MQEGTFYTSIKKGQKLFLLKSLEQQNKKAVFKIGRGSPFTLKNN
jgi:hypothetical protein